MKFNKFFAVIAIMFTLFSGVANAAVVLKEDGAYKGLVEIVNVTTGLDASVSGDTGTILANGSQTITGGTIAGVTINSSSVGATTPSTGAFTTLSTTLGVTHTRTPSADSATTNKASSVAYTVPADTTGTNTHDGYLVTPTIGNATGGTNTFNGFEVANITGDAQVDTNGLKIGTSDGLGTATAINIGTGWDAALKVGAVSGFPTLEQNATVSRKFFAASDTVASGQTSKTTSITGITSAAKCVVTGNEVTTNASYFRAAVAGSAQVVVTVNTDPGASNYDYSLLCWE